MKKKKRIYNYIENLELLELKPNWPLDDDAMDRALYDLGNVKIPRSMLMSTKFQNLKPTSKSVYLWLMAKEEIIKKKRRAWIEDIETERKEGIIMASKREIARYTGIRIDNLGASIEELLAVDLVKMEQVKDGKKVIATVWQIVHWDIDKRGYVKMPLSVMISPAWQDLSHETRILYIALLSEHCSQKKKQNEKFPVFTLSYNQIKARYGLSKNTIRLKQGKKDKEDVEERMRTKKVRINESGNAKTGIKALEDTGLIICEHGKYIVTPNPEDPDNFKNNDVKLDLNHYVISTDFMYELPTEPQEEDNDNNTTQILRRYEMTDMECLQKEIKLLQLCIENSPGEVMPDCDTPEIKELFDELTEGVPLNWKEVRWQALESTSIPAKELQIQLMQEEIKKILKQQEHGSYTEPTAELDMKSEKRKSTLADRYSKKDYSSLVKDTKPKRKYKSDGSSFGSFDIDESDFEVIVKAPKKEDTTDEIAPTFDDLGWD